MKVILFAIVFALFIVAISASCNVVSCSSYCQQIGHFSGYCIGNNLENCHCYDVGHGKD